ncbi:MAG: tetratricopeptide repeat protein [Myxococcales bacterium]|nr:tetratricopeptide repeat protein [Myxococcales bacterium]USN51018.1 MAG: tetratricopeptide repeat protein [Myxococcales bacterium]
MVVIHKKKIETEEEKEARKRQEEERAMGLQDEYQAKGFELVSWVQEHKGIVTGLIAALFLAGGAFGAFLYYQKRSNEQASSAYISALRPIENLPKTGEENTAKWTDAKNQLVGIAKTHGGSGVGNLAGLYAAHIALENNEAKLAVELYQDASKRLKVGDELYPFAMLGLGYAYQKNGQPAEALSSFQALIEQKIALGRESALWEAARLAEKEKALKYVELLLEEFPGSSYESAAKRLRDSL